MKRMLAVTIACSLSTVLLFSSPGNAQAPLIVRGFAQVVTAKTTPKRDRVRPHTFTTTGRVVPAPRYCDPGVNPIPGAGNCIPILCPPGVLDVRYCLRPGRSVICSGVVTVRFQRVTTTISSRNVGVRPDCTYRSRVTFRLRLPTRRGVFRVRARFQGNPVMQPRNSATHTVRAG